jgi:pilus assembly protein CpaB
MGLNPDMGEVAMARTVAGAAPSRTNRRFLIIAVLLAAVSAVLVYAKIAADDTTSGRGAATSDTAQVVVAKAEIPANSVITTDMLEIRNVGVNGIATDALSDPASAVGRVTKYPIAANAQVSLGAIVDTAKPAEALSELIPTGKRAISITASQIGNAGGLVLPGDYVDLVWICCNGDDIISKTLLRNVQVAAIAQTLVPAAPQAGSTEQPVPGSDVPPVPDASTTTLFLTPQEAQIIALAEGRGSLRIALRGDGDEAIADTGTAILSDILTPEEVARLPEGLRPEGYQNVP